MPYSELRPRSNLSSLSLPSFLPCFVSDAVADKEEIENEENERTDERALARAGVNSTVRGNRLTLLLGPRSAGGQQWQKILLFSTEMNFFYSLTTAGFLKQVMCPFL